MSKSQERFFDLLIDTILADIAAGKKKDAAKLLIMGAEIAEAAKMGKKPMRFY